MTMESAALLHTAKRRIYRMACETCAKETLFQGLKCLVCGLFRPAKLALADRRPEQYGKVPGVQRKRVKLRNSDRREHWAQLAAESRAKFEGAPAVTEKYLPAASEFPSLPSEREVRR